MSIFQRVDVFYDFRELTYFMAKAATSGANLGFEAKLFLTADKLRGSMDASEYKHVALGFVNP